jgi:hypothetical protein
MRRRVTRLRGLREPKRQSSQAGNIPAARAVQSPKFLLKNHDVMNIDVNPHLLTATANATVPPVQGVHAMDQKMKPWAFPKPHPENTPRGERNKQEFDAPTETPKPAPKPRSKKEPPAASRARS